MLSKWQWKPALSLLSIRHLPQSSSSRQGLLGIFLYEGWQAPKDVMRGVALSRESCEAGSAWGQFAYARCCFHGIGDAPKDSELSTRLYALAANQNLPKAQCNLGYWLVGWLVGWPVR